MYGWCNTSNLNSQTSWLKVKFKLVNFKHPTGTIAQQGRPFSLENSLISQGNSLLP